MKNTTSKFIITATIEQPLERQGFMLEGLYRPISLVGDSVDLEFDYVPKEVHPDVIALICYVAFYPYLTNSKSVTFPLEISLTAKAAFENFNTFTIQNAKIVDCPPISVTNASPYQKPYESENGTVIAFGGGMDSTSVSLLFPEYTVVNQLDTYDQKPAMLNLFAAMKEKNPKFSGYTHYTNIRSLNTPYGFSGWLCCYLLPLLVAGDTRAKGIVTGAIFGSAYMSGTGGRFNRDALKWGNPFGVIRDKPHRNWTTLFESIGFSQFSPVAGITEILTAKLIHESGLTEDCLYCQRMDGRQCHACYKCFRKNLELEFWEIINTSSPRPTEYWARYNNAQVINYYKNNYQYFGHLMNFLSQSLPKSNKPEWFRRNAHFCNANTSWVTKVYSRAIKNVHKDYEEIVKSRLSEHFQFMDQTDLMLCENYDCRDYDFYDFNIDYQRKHDNQ